MESNNHNVINTTPLQRTDRTGRIQNFRFVSGHTMSELRLQYSTLGTPRYDADGTIRNAVVLLHSSTGNRLHWFSEPMVRGLFGAGQPLDASRYFIIVPDLIGHGQSSKPSDGLRTRFPPYRCQDLVNAVHLLVSRGLKIPRLQLVMGTSLGAMMAWLWGEMYPDSTERLMPIGAYPLPLAGRNWIIRRMSIDAIRHDPDWQEGEYTQPPRHYLHTAPLLILLAHGVKQLHALGPDRQAADRYYQTLIQHMAKHDANDLLYVLEAAQDYDPSPDLENITARVMAINFEGDEICRPELAETDPALKRLPNARFVLIPANQQGCGHFTYYEPDTWTSHLAEFMK